MTVIEILEDVAASVESTREALAAEELKLRNIMPPCVDLDDPCSLTSEDAADWITTARSNLIDAIETLECLKSAARARSLNFDKDKEVE